MTLETVEINEHAIQDAIMQLEEKSAAGPGYIAETMCNFRIFASMHIVEVIS